MACLRYRPVWGTNLDQLPVQFSQSRRSASGRLSSPGNSQIARELPEYHLSFRRELRLSLIHISAGPYTALDLSKTQTAYTKGQTGQVVVYGVKGDVSEQITTGVTFLSSDPAVVQVDASTGAITAMKEGYATVTATSSGVSQKVFLIVYNELKGTTDFVSEPDIKVVYDMNESISTPASEAYSFDSSNARIGGKSLLTKTIVNSQMLTTTGARFYTCLLYTSRCV